MCSYDSRDEIVRSSSTIRIWKIRYSNAHSARLQIVDIDHYLMPTLYLMLGIVNYLYKNMVEESQAACEACSLDYFEAERIWE